MRDEFGLRTKRRSPLRLKCGAMYYTARRKLLWHSGKFHFSNGVSDRPLPCIQYAHSTPLLRQLRDVEMVYQYNKIVNLKLAVPHLDGVVIQPGETLSYWKRIGKPSRRRCCPRRAFRCHMPSGTTWLPGTRGQRRQETAFPRTPRSQRPPQAAARVSAAECGSGCSGRPRSVSRPCAGYLSDRDQNPSLHSDSGDRTRLKQT